MSHSGQYANDCDYTLPESWNPVGQETLQTALSQALEALTGDEPLRRLGYFYDPLGEYADTSFLDAGHNSALSIEADDLYAVSRDPGPVRDQATELLATLPPALTLTAGLDAGGSSKR